MKKFTIFLFSLFGIISTFSILTSCTKDTAIDNHSGNSQNSEIRIQEFGNDSLFQIAVQRLLTSSMDEIKANEKAQGFKSFGSICQEFYETIDPEQFKSFDEIKNFAEKHSKYVQLIQDANGEYTLEVIAYNNPFRFMANENKELIVGTKKCNLTEDAIVYIENQIPIAISPQKKSMEYHTQAAASPLDHYFYDTPTSGGERVVVEFNNFLSRDLAVEGSIVITNYRIQPYKRTLGVWFQCNRTLGLEYEFRGTLYTDIRSYPIDNFVKITTSKPENRLIGGEKYKICSVWDANYHMNVYKYRFLGWSGSGLSREFPPK